MMGPWGVSLLRTKPASWLLTLNLLLLVSHPDVSKAHQVPKPVESKKKQPVHTVRKGETLSGIAKLYGVSLRGLIEINRLSRPDALRAGQRLLLPEPGRPAVANAILENATPIRPAGPPAHFVFSPPNLNGTAPTFRWPLDGPVSSHFGRRRNGWHAGIDIKVGIGTPILAVASGTVVFSDWERSYGRVVKIRHDHDFVSVYAHNLQNLVEVGDEVYPGRVIGTVGRSGRTTAYHLHFEIWNDGKAHDPIALLPARPLLFVADDEVQPEDDGEEHE
jgi:murein DD-endopeptidase MepM/ murein hydrolase activator NlpD